MKFFRISRQIPENSDVCRFFNQICENKSEICRKFWILWKKFTIIVNYSLHSLAVAPARSRLLVVGGSNEGSVGLAEVEVYDPQASAPQRAVEVRTGRLLSENWKKN